MGRTGVLSILFVFGLLLGVHDGYIALWQGNDPAPAQVFPYRAAMLPEHDQALLKEGIPIGNTGRLHSLLEDYLS